MSSSNVLFFANLTIFIMIFQFNFLAADSYQQLITNHAFTYTSLSSNLGAYFFSRIKQFSSIFRASIFQSFRHMYDDKKIFLFFQLFLHYLSQKFILHHLELIIKTFFLFSIFDSLHSHYLTLQFVHSLLDFTR